jgi:hypothetical protein
MGGATTSDAKASSETAAAKSGGINDIIPPQFDANGIPLLQPGARGTLDSYKNVIVWVKAGISNIQIDRVVSKLNSIGVTINYAFQTPATNGTTIILLERVEIAKIQSIKTIPNVVNTKELALDFGWKKGHNTINFGNFGTYATFVTGTTTLNLENNLPGSEL